MNKSNLFSLIKTYDWRTLVLCLLLLFPILTVNQNNYFIAFVTLVALITVFFNGKEKMFASIGKKLLLSASFIALFFSLLYSANKVDGIFEIEKRLVLIIYPIIFILLNKSITLKDKRLFEYLFVSIILVFFTWVNAKLFLKFNEAINSGVIVASWKEAITSESFSYYYREFFIRISGIHPTYASIYSLFASGILILSLLDRKHCFKPKMKYLILLIISVLLIYSLFLSAKGPLLAFVLALLVVLFFKFKRLHFILIGTSLVLLIVLSTLLFPPLKSRVNEIFKQNTSEQISSVSIRKIIHKTSWQLIKNNSLLGVGVGDVQDKLDEEYRSYNENKVSSGKLNTHNEYFNMWLSVGLLGLIALLITIVLPLTEAVKMRNYNYLFFLVFIAICFFFENILSRQKGVLFIAFFYLIYYFNQIENLKCQQDIQKI